MTVVAQLKITYAGKSKAYTLRNSAIGCGSLDSQTAHSSLVSFLKNISVLSPVR
jgi:hypothetical protein